MTTAAPARPARRLKPPIRRTPGKVLAFLALGLVPPAAVVVVLLLVYVVVPSVAVDHQTSPTGAVRGLLDAMLHRHDVAATDKYLCDGDAGSAVHEQVTDQVRKITAFNARPGSAISYTWTVRQVAKTGDRATVRADVESELTVDGTPTAPVSRSWTLGLRNRTGWRVCTLRIPER